MTGPVRLRLSRAKGFDLQALSRETNGLPAINVARPSRWGNPFLVGVPDTPTAQAAAERYRQWWEMLPQVQVGQRLWVLSRRLPEIAGHNLACWCKPGTPCHADVLLRIANPLRCGDVDG